MPCNFRAQTVAAKTCDVSSESQVNELAAFALRELGALDVLVLNAGIYGPMGPTESVSLDEWRRAIDINLFGVLLPSRALIPHFKKAGGGKIIVLSGGGATNPLPNISAYAASKAAVVRLMETLAEELKPFHVDVNAIAPGALATRLVDEVLGAGPEKVGAAFFEKNKVWKEKGAVPLELGASLAVYLASAESKRHHRQTDQRAVGSVERFPKTTAMSWQRRTSTACAASSRKTVARTGSDGPPSSAGGS